MDEATELEIRVTNVIENARNAPIVRDWVRKLLRARDEVGRLEGEILTLNTDCLRKNGRINELKAENWQLSDDNAQVIQYAVDVKAQMAETNANMDLLAESNRQLGDRVDELIQNETRQDAGSLAEGLERTRAEMTERLTMLLQDEESQHGG